MIVHVVLFRPKADLTPGGRQRLADAFEEALGEIGSIKRARLGRRLTLGRPYEQLVDEAFTYAAILEFTDLAGIEEYLDHPVHKKLATEFFVCCEQSLMYDFDLNDGPGAVRTLV